MVAIATRRPVSSRGADIGPWVRIHAFISYCRPGHPRDKTGPRCQRQLVRTLDISGRDFACGGGDGGAIPVGVSQGGSCPRQSLSASAATLVSPPASLSRPELDGLNPIHPCHPCPVCLPSLPLAVWPDMPSNHLSHQLLTVPVHFSTHSQRPRSSDLSCDRVWNFVGGSDGSDQRDPRISACACSSQPPTMRWVFCFPYCPSSVCLLCAPPCNKVSCPHLPCPVVSSPGVPHLSPPARTLATVLALPPPSAACQLGLHARGILCTFSSWFAPRSRFLPRSSLVGNCPVGRVCANHIPDLDRGLPPLQPAQVPEVLLMYPLCAHSHPSISTHPLLQQSRHLPSSSSSI